MSRKRSFMETLTGYNGGVSFEEKTFEWKLPNFSSIAKSEELLNQQKVEFQFLTSKGVRSAWRAYLSIFTAGTNLEPTKTIQLKFGLIEKNGCCSETQALVSHKIADTSGKILFSKTTDDVKCEKNRFKYWSLFNLTTEAEGNWTTLPEDTLIINTSVKFLTQISEPTCRVDVEAICANQQKKLCQKFETLVNDPTHSDVKIVSGDGQEFFAYRWILSAMSEVFEAMFRTDMRETQTGIVEIKDLSGKTFKVILDFIYTGKVRDEWSQPGIVEELIYGTEKYQLEDLKSFLDVSLVKICTLENAGNLLALARSTSMDKAVADIMAFINEKALDVDGFLEIVRNAD